MNATVTYTLDWLTVSFDWNANHRVYLPQPCFGVTDAKIAPLPAYNRAAKLGVGRLDWHTDKINQKRLLTFSGSDLVKLPTHDITQVELLQRLLALPDCNITRLDFAVDILNGEMTAGDVKTLLERGHVSTNARRSTDIEERIMGSEGSGMTVYVGSRSSMLMLRVYDKGKKEKTDFPWLRIELEAKQGKANLIAKRILETSLAGAGCEAIRQYASIDSPEISDALSGAIPMDLKVGRKMTDWEKWVIETALPNVAKGYDQQLPQIVRWIRKAAYNEDRPLKGMLNPLR